MPFRFKRFADRVLGPDASDADRGALKQKLGAIGKFLLDWQNTYDKTIAGKKTADGKQQQKDTEEGFGRLDALNRIGNQVFSQDLTLSGVAGFEKNLHAQDAPVSFPPIWTVPWLKYAQYDASIEQPLIRNAGEALGVTALLNLSSDYPRGHALPLVGRPRQSALDRDDAARPRSLRPERQSSFGGLTSPKWPSQIFGDDPAWKINPERVTKGRKLYAEICAECHLGPVNDPTFDAQFPEKSIWSSDHWERSGKARCSTRFRRTAKEHGNGPRAGRRAVRSEPFRSPASSTCSPRATSQTGGDARDLSSRPLQRTCRTRSRLMVTVDLVSRKWMADQHVSTKQREKLWGDERTVPTPSQRDRTIARGPLNGVWATAPYLHNGSVPSLYWMLTPAAERPQEVLHGGARDFDPEQVGFRVDRREPTVQERTNAVLDDAIATEARSTATAWPAIRSRGAAPATRTASSAASSRRMSATT